MAMDAKDLRTEAVVGARSNDGSAKFASSGNSLDYNRNKPYQENGSNSLAKVDGAPARPCAVIGPDRVVPPNVSNDSYLKKGPIEPWPYSELRNHRPHKMTDYQHPSRNISPRQTYQENMQRVMVPPTYNSVKLTEDPNYSNERNITLPKNVKLNMPGEVKYCDVPYNVTAVTNEQKSAAIQDVCVPNANQAVSKSVPGWPPGSTNIRPPRAYGAHETYQYPDYPSCAGPRPAQMIRPHRALHEEPGQLYSEPFYRDGSIRFKPYPPAKDRFPHARYDYISNYTNSFHPPFSSHKYDIQKSVPPHPYTAYPQIPVKWDNRMVEPVIDGYQRTNLQSNYNVPFRNQVVHPPYGPVPGNCLQNKLYPFPPDASSKTISLNRPPYEISNKIYLDYENSRGKPYAISDNFYMNEQIRPRNQVGITHYPQVNMHSIPPHPYYRKDIPSMKNYDFPSNYRVMDSSINANNPMARLTTQFSPSALTISPVDSNTSNDTTHTQGTLQEDCGYVSQSSTTSIRSIDSGTSRIPNDPYRRYDYRYSPLVRNSPLLLKTDMAINTGKEKKDLDVRQFLQMWNEGDDENNDSHANRDIVVQTANNITFPNKYEVINNQEQLYVLGLETVPSEELSKYDHIQKVSKLPENIKGYNSIELLNQFEEAIESSKISNFNITTPAVRDFQFSAKVSVSKPGVLPRSVSPLDVEAKISQSVIHKEVGCNFEIKPCSPKMLNVEIAAPVQSLLNERTIEKVANPLISSPDFLNIQEELKNRNTMKSDNNNATDENLKIASCKMITTKYVSDGHLNSGKNYNFQDLESNAGVCLASLPRLDNDIELNFPEVNQQFINANKANSNLPPLDKDSSENTYSKDKLGVRPEAIVPYQFSPSVENESEFVKLSKYRKAKKSDVESKICNESHINVQSLRTDSVIIKNPENTKFQEEYTETVRNSINELLGETQNSPIDAVELAENMTTTISVQESIENIKTLNTAIDCSLGNNQNNDRSLILENSSKEEILKSIVTSQKHENTEVLDITETNLKNEKISQLSEKVLVEKENGKSSNDSNDTECVGSNHVTQVAETKASFKIDENVSVITLKVDDFSEEVTLNNKEVPSATKLQSNECIDNIDNSKCSSNDCAPELIETQSIVSKMDESGSVLTAIRDDISHQPISLYKETEQITSEKELNEHCNFKGNYNNLESISYTHKFKLPAENNIDVQGSKYVEGVYSQPVNNNPKNMNPELSLRSSHFDKELKEHTICCIKEDADSGIGNINITSANIHNNHVKCQNETSIQQSNIELDSETILDTFEIQKYSNKHNITVTNINIENIDKEESATIFECSNSTVLKPCIKKSRRVVCSLRKELFSPWIQKLLLHKEGLLYNNNNISNVSSPDKKDHVESVDDEPKLNYENNVNIENTSTQTVYIAQENILERKETSSPIAILAPETDINLKLSNSENCKLTDNEEVIDADSHISFATVTAITKECTETNPDIINVSNYKSETITADIIPQPILTEDHCGHFTKTTSMVQNENTIPKVLDFCKKRDIIINNDNIEIQTFRSKLESELKTEDLTKSDFGKHDVNHVNELSSSCLSQKSPPTPSEQIQILYNNEIILEEERSLNNINFLKNRQSHYRHRSSLKRSLSDSALDGILVEALDDVENKCSKILPAKRKKNDDENILESNLITENIRHIIQNNRRNSVSSIYNDENVSFCILIDENCIITEESESEKNCCTEMKNPLHSEPENASKELDNNSEIAFCQQEKSKDYSSEPFILNCAEIKRIEESWVDDIGCIETVVSDEIIEEEIVLSEPSSPNNFDLSDSDSKENDIIFENVINEHTNKVKHIYGDTLCNDDAQLLDTLYRTPQMDVKKTLDNRESHSKDYKSENLQCEKILSNISHKCDTEQFCLVKEKSGFSDPLPVDINIFTKEDEVPMVTTKSNTGSDFNVAKSERIQHSLVHSCELSMKEMFSSIKKSDVHELIPNSPEVSSTTTEDKNSSIIIKNNNAKASTLLEVNNVMHENNINCKYTEQKLFCKASSDLPPPRPIITKGAQKYIPPIKETIPDLKVKLPLPQHSLNKLKLLKISKKEPKLDDNLRKHTIFKKDIPKKQKPKFEDVLKSIDEIQIKMHKEKSKKPKKYVPKVVIKKNENGSHYASTSKDNFDPDLTGRKWQPWVFLEKNEFIDKMALRKKVSAVFNHRKKTYVLAEKFQKYKSISSAKFIISQQNLNESSTGQLKYTIRLKHSY